MGSTQFKIALVIILQVVLFGLIFLAFAGLNVRVKNLEAIRLPVVQRVMEVVTPTATPSATPAVRVLAPTKKVVK